MNSDEFKKIEEIYLSALETSPDQRKLFLDKQCGVGNKLRKEVELLLSYEDSSENFLDEFPDQLAAEVLNKTELTDYSNKKVKHFEILHKISKGGMGVVYLAQDRKLDRRVAIKFLDKRFSQDDDRLRRFMREAKTASALNHPNIITIYEVGEVDDT